MSKSKLKDDIATFIVGIIFVAIIVGVLGIPLWVSFKRHSVKYSNIGIPERVEHIEFYNGGSKIFESDNVETILLQMNNKRNFINSDYKYEIYIITEKNGRVTNIVDSDAMSILFR